MLKACRGSWDVEGSPRSAEVEACSESGKMFKALLDQLDCWRLSEISWVLWIHSDIERCSGSIKVVVLYQLICLGLVDILKSVLDQLIWHCSGSTLMLKVILNWLRWWRILQMCPRNWILLQISYFESYLNRLIPHKN